MIKRKIFRRYLFFAHKLENEEKLLKSILLFFFFKECFYVRWILPKLSIPRDAFVRACLFDRILVLSLSLKVFPSSFSRSISSVRFLSNWLSNIATALPNDFMGKPVETMNPSSVFQQPREMTFPSLGLAHHWPPPQHPTIDPTASLTSLFRCTSRNNWNENPGLMRECFSLLHIQPNFHCYFRATAATSQTV